MKIALVHRRFTTNGGMERWLVGFARFLVGRGEDVTVLCNDVRSDLDAEPGIRFLHLPMFRPAKLISLWWSARRALAAASFDAVMGFGRTPGHQLFRAGNGSHAEYLRRLHPLRRWVSPMDRLETALDRRAIESARIVIANSKLGAAGIRRDYRPRSVEVVYNGVDLGLFAPDPQVRRVTRQQLGIPGPLAVFLGSGARRKGLDVAIAALPAGWTLLVAGNDPPVAAPAHVRFLGLVREPERFLQSADVMVLPTRYDPFANSCLEALACGIPVLTTSANGASEILPEDWMTVDDLPALRQGFERVEKIGNDPALRALCRATAERYPAVGGYERTFELLKQAAS